ncbi:MAG: alpha-amylase family glycosyl hydrolase [Bacteroidota bacterium]
MNKTSLALLGILCIGFFFQSFAQVSTIPVFPTENDTVTIIFDAKQGNGELAGVSPPIYAHTGVITDLSTTPTSWRHVQGNWGVADARMLMTPLGNDVYQIRYHIPTFYNVPANETVLRLGFVFRDETGNNVGRAADGSDIFVDMFGAGLNVRFDIPVGRDQIVDLNATLPVALLQNGGDSLRFYEDNVLLASTDQATLNFNVTASNPGEHMLVAEAFTASASVFDTVYYFARPAPNVANVPTGWRDGINILNDSTVGLVLLAPQKQHVFAIGGFNDWRFVSDGYMNVTPDRNRYWIQLSGLDPSLEYVFQYLVDGVLRIADPYSEKILDPWSDPFISATTYPNLIPYPTGKTDRIAGVFQTDKPAYQWKVNNFQPPAIEDLVVYELLIRDFSDESSFQGVIDSLDYLVNLGVNAIEFMPFSEFENNDSWGYNPSFFFAVDKYYGTENKLKELIDECHARGIAVIQDMVLNHAFGQCPLAELYWDPANNRPAPNNPWFNPIPRHDFNVGNDFNHDSQATREFSIRVMKYWLREFRVDGYRFDLSKGFTQKNTLGNIGAWNQYDADRVALWKLYADSLWTENPDAYVILEHFADNSEERELANYGMMFWGNHNFNYNEATMGYHNGSNSDFGGIFHQVRNWNDPHLLGFMESHDEERLMFKNIEFGNQSGPYSTKDTANSLDRIELAATFFFTIPGPKMIWQFGELGYDYSIDFNSRLGRKPLRWDYFQDPDRRAVYDVFSDLAKLKISEPAFKTGTVRLDLRNALKRIHLDHSSMDVAVLGNFDVIQATINPAFQRTGKWYEFFTGDSLNVTNVSDGISLQPGEYRLYTTKKLARSSGTTTSVEENIEMSLLSIYPNPLKNQGLNVLLTLNKTSDVSLSLYNAMGQEVQNKFFRKLSPGSQLLKWNLSPEQLPEGVYILRINGNSQGVSQRILIQR